MVYIKNYKDIYCTQGDYVSIRCQILEPDDTPYTPQSGDRVVFRLAKTFDSNKILEKNLIGNSQLQLLPVETNNLPFGEYVYDIRLKRGALYNDTFICEGKFTVGRGLNNG